MRYGRDASIVGLISVVIVHSLVGLAIARAAFEGDRGACDKVAAGNPTSGAGRFAVLFAVLFRADWNESPCSQSGERSGWDGLLCTSRCNLMGRWSLAIVSFRLRVIGFWRLC